MKRIITLAFAVICLAAAAFAQEKKTVAVYVNGDCDENIKKVISSRVIAQIVRSEEYAVVEHTEDFDNALFKERKIRISGNLDDGEVIKLAKQFGAKLVCVADVSKREFWDEYLFTVRLINIETGLVISFSLADYAGNSLSQESAISITDRITTQLLKDVTKDVTTIASKQKLAVYVTSSSDVFKAKTVSSRLTQNFTNSGAYAVVDRTSDFRAELDRQHTDTVEFEPKQIAKYGKQFGVNQFCVVEVLSTDYTHIRIINVETTVIAATADTMNWRIGAVDGITRKLLTRLASLTCTGKDEQLRYDFMECCEGLVNVNGVCRDTRCIGKDQPIPGDYARCCSGLVNVNGICRDTRCIEKDQPIPGDYASCCFGLKNIKGICRDIINNPEYREENVSGKVTDKEGKPISALVTVIKRTSSASVTVKETPSTARADLKGEYFINARSGDVLEFSKEEYHTKTAKVTTDGKSTINVTLRKPYIRKHGLGIFPSYIYDSNPISAAGPMHGVSLFALFEKSRWGVYASFRANSSFFEKEPTLPVSSFALNAGPVFTLFHPVSLYLSPGVGYNSYRHLPGENAPETESEWFFSPEIGVMFDFNYISIFGGVKYPLPHKDSYEKLLYSAGAGFAIDRLIRAKIKNEPYTFLSYIYDRSPLSDAGPMHGVSLFSFFENSRWGWYGSFRANSSFFEPTPTRPVSTFAFNAGPVLTLFNPVSLYLSAGVGSNSYHHAPNENAPETESEWFFNPEIGILFNFEYASIFGGLKYPLPSKDSYEKLLYSAGAGFNITHAGRARLKWFISYTADIPVTTTVSNPPGYIGLSMGVMGRSGIVGGYYSLRANPLVLGVGEYKESGYAHAAGSAGTLVRLFPPLYFSLGLGGYWEWSKETDPICYLMPELGVHLLCFNNVFLSFGRSFPGLKNDKVIYTAGIGWAFRD
jgi:opacity protein-like surface antigen